jgi:hypothetical protein
LDNTANLKEYATALWTGAVGKLSSIGSIVFTVLAFIISAREAKYAFAILAGLCVLWAGYEVWKVERNRYIEVIKAAAKADLAISIVECYRSWRSNLLLNIEVVNRSAVSVTVKGVNLEIVSGNQTIPFKYRENATNSEARFVADVINENRQVLQVRSTQDLLDEISGHPLERGVHKSGCLIFRFDKLPATDVLLLRLTLTDAFGDKHTTAEDVTTIKGVWSDI